MCFYWLWFHSTILKNASDRWKIAQTLVCTIAIAGPCTYHIPIISCLSSVLFKRLSYGTTLDSLGALNHQIFAKTTHTYMHTYTQTYTHTWPEQIFYWLLDSGFAPSALSLRLNKSNEKNTQPMTLPQHLVQQYLINNFSQKNRTYFCFNFPPPKTLVPKHFPHWWRALKELHSWEHFDNTMTEWTNQWQDKVTSLHFAVNKLCMRPLRGELVGMLYYYVHICQWILF